MSSETPYFGPSYEYQLDPDFRPSYLDLERDLPSVPVEPGVVIRPVLGKRLNLSFVYFEPRSTATASPTCVCRSGSWSSGTGSDSPVPRRSKWISRPKALSRRRNRAKSGKSQTAST